MVWPSPAGATRRPTRRPTLRRARGPAYASYPRIYAWKRGSRPESRSTPATQPPLRLAQADRAAPPPRGESDSMMSPLASVAPLLHSHCGAACASRQRGFSACESSFAAHQCQATHSTPAATRKHYPTLWRRSPSLSRASFEFISSQSPLQLRHERRSPSTYRKRAGVPRLESGRARLCVARAPRIRRQSQCTWHGTFQVTCMGCSSY